MENGLDKVKVLKEKEKIIIYIELKERNNDLECTIKTRKTR